MSEPRTPSALVEPCEFCKAPATGPEYSTPHGICASCACTKCRGFRWWDDRGFVVVGQPFLDKTSCTQCGGEGTREAENRCKPIAGVSL